MDDNQPTDLQSDEIFDPMQYLGRTLETSNNEYKVLDYLGEGLTAVVYKARQSSSERDTALKMLRPSASQLSKMNFWEELSILRNLRSVGLKCVPTILDHQKGQDPEFLVMDLVSPDEYPGLHQVLKSKPYLSEEEALAIFSEALFLLDKLHTVEQRTYIDMQLRNFCWNSAEQSLIVMDWNHVSYSKDLIEQELIKEPDQRNLDVLQQLRARGAGDFNDLVQLDLRRLTTYFYTLLTGKGANELGETVWSLESRVGGFWKTISLASRQIFLRVLTPRSTGRALDSAAKILAEVKFAQELLIKNDIDDLQNEFDEFFDRAKGIGVQEQPDEMYRAAAYLDRTERINDPRLVRWLNRQKTLLQEAEGFESSEWRKGRNFYRVGSFGEASRYWDQEAEASGAVQRWRWALIARICGDTSGTLDEEKQKLLPPLLESAIENLQQGKCQKAKIDLDNAQELITQPIIGWWLDEIHALTLLNNLELSSETNEPLKTVDILDEITISPFWDNLPYTRILLQDKAWYLAAQKVLGLSKAEELQQDETSTFREILQKLAQQLRAKQLEISSRADLLENLQNLEFEPFRNKLKKALFDAPNNPYLVRTALDYINNRNVNERLEIIGILSGWAHLDKGLKAEVMDCHKRLYRDLFEELTTRASKAIEDQHLLLALDSLNKSKLALRTLHGLGEDEKTRQERINGLNDRIGTEEKIQKLRWTQAQLVWDIEDLIKKSKNTVYELQIEIWGSESYDSAHVKTALDGLKKDLNQLQDSIAKMPETEQESYLAMYAKLSKDYNLCLELSQSKDIPEYKKYFINAVRKFEEIKGKSQLTGKRAESAEMQSVREEMRKARQIINRLGSYK